MMKNRHVRESLRGIKSAKTSEIKAKVKSFLENRKNVNNLLDILIIMESEEEAMVIAAIRGLHRVFTVVLKNSELTTSGLVSAEKSDLTSEEKYSLWLQETYSDVVTKLLQFMQHEKESIQELSLCSLMKLVQTEGEHPILKRNKQQTNTFPVALYQKILRRLLSADTVLSSLIGRAQEFMEYDDVRCYTMIYLLELLKQITDQANELFMKNLFAMLQILSIPDQSPDRRPSYLVTSTAGVVSDLKGQRKQYGNLWIEFLKNKLSVAMYKNVLVILCDKVMPHMSNPVALCDFLTQAYNVGGAISLLALNGLFVLIQKHNLNYPDFYTKLYGLLDQNILHLKYRARFFYLTDLFLTSTHLPVYLVAAFIKRLSRLALSAPTDALIFTLPLIYNLMIRHSNTQTLIHRENAQDVDSDPFKAMEMDPLKCGALESSLWEIRTLQMHYHPDVAQMARKINGNLPEQEFVLADRLDTKYDQLFTKEIEKPMDKVHTSFQPVTQLFGGKDDSCADLWILE